MSEALWEALLSKETPLRIILPDRIVNYLAKKQCNTAGELSKLFTTELPANVCRIVTPAEVLVVLLALRKNKIPYDEATWNTWEFQYTHVSVEGKEELTELQLRIRGTERSIESAHQSSLESIRRRSGKSDAPVAPVAATKSGKKLGRPRVDRGPQPVSVRRMASQMRNKEYLKEDSDPKMTAALEVQADEAEAFMLAYYLSGVPFDPLKAALKVGVIDAREVDSDPEKAKDSANRRMLAYRDKLDAQGRLEGIRRRAGIDVPGIRDSVIKAITSALSAHTAEFVKLDTEGVIRDDECKPVDLVMSKRGEERIRGIVYGKPDHFNRIKIVSVICKDFGITWEELQRVGGNSTVKQATTPEEAISDLIDAVIRTLNGFGIDFDDFAKKVKDRMRMQA